MASLIDIAEAVAAEMNGGSFSLPFMAQCMLLPVFDRKDMAALHVTVVPRGQEMTLIARDAAQWDYHVDVAVQQQVDPANLDDLRALSGLVDEIIRSFAGRRLRECPEAIFIKAASEPPYLPEHLEKLRQFTGVVTLTFRTAEMSE